MKKTLIAILTILCVCCLAFGLTACGEKSSTHIHTPSSVCEHDENTHWHICTTCGEKCNVENHSYNERNTCQSCGYINPTSLYYFDNGTITGLTGYGQCAEELVIPTKINNQDVVKLGDNLFANNTIIKEVTIQDNIVIIGNNSFMNCYKLKTLKIGNGVKQVGSDAFSGCLIENVTIPCNLIRYLSNYTQNMILTTGTTIENAAFQDCSKLTSITIPDSVTSIGNYAFDGCTSLKSITISNGVTSIGENTFYDCTSLKKVNYTGTIDSWCGIKFASINSNPLSKEAELYINDTLVTEVKIEKATKINAYAFYACTSIQSIKIGKNVTYIGIYAFYNCTSVKSTTFINTTGWTVSNEYYTPRTISSSTLSNEVSATRYLIKSYSNGYADFIWTKS